MRVYAASLAVGVMVNMIYALLNVRPPAPLLPLWVCSASCLANRSFPLAISLAICAAFPGPARGSTPTWLSTPPFNETKRQVGLLRMLQAGVIVSDYASLMIEILKDNASPQASAVYAALDMPWAKLVGQIAHAYGK